MSNCHLVCILIKHPHQVLMPCMIHINHSLRYYFLFRSASLSRAISFRRKFCTFPVLVIGHSVDPINQTCRGTLKRARREEHKFVMSRREQEAAGVISIKAAAASVVIGSASSI